VALVLRFNLITGLPLAAENVGSLITALVVDVYLPSEGSLAILSTLSVFRYSLYNNN
jgi:hypothetical protein|tara:strand:- start:76 stop:246 length:171 start_codon:yes stop_codon:yes gene_type:complete